MTALSVLRNQESLIGSLLFIVSTTVATLTPSAVATCARAASTRALASSP